MQAGGGLTVSKLCVYGQNVTMAMISMTNQESISRDVTFPALVTGICCVAGGFLVVILGTHEPITVQFAALVVCVGFGIILGALGTRATGKWLGWTIAGGGAISFPLLLLFHFYLSPGFTKLGRIEISHPDYSKVSELRIIDGHQPLYAYRDATTKSVQFIMLTDKFTNPRVYI